MGEAHFPEEPPDRVEWDVAVVGTGMGGATAGYALAKRGRRVLFIEKGLLLHGRDAAAPARPGDDEQPQARLASGRWPLRLRGTTSFGDIEFHAPLGCGSGGTTSLYAAALERLSPADFRPRANHPHAADSTLPERWPISYEELRPYYAQAEELYRVCGTPDPLGDEAASLRPPPAPSERDRHFVESFRGRGLHPYRVHVGYEFIDGCTECPAQLCRRACKSDAARICLLPALERHGARLLPECEVLALDAGRSEVRTLRCRRKGEALEIRAKIVVLAAGAFMSPILLLNSRSPDWPQGLANDSGLVGRNLMLHASDFIAVAPTRPLPAVGPQKALALNDFYFAGGEKLGTFQSAGAAVTPGQIMQHMRAVAERERTWWKKLASPRPWWWRKLSSPAVRLAALAMYYLLNFRSSAIWATIVEDLPYHDNRVVPDAAASSGMRFEYRYPDELKKRVQSFRRRLAAALHPHRMLVLNGDDNINYGHVCGTCRFGDDPAASVLDRDNRAHGIRNLYVVDASFFPSSGGTNPTLTIAANALRVAEVIDRQLG